MYRYENEKPQIFTASGQVTFLQIRDNVQQLLRKAGSVRMLEAISAASSGSSWTMLACVDRMVELGELREITNPDRVYGQDRVFVCGKEDR